MLNDPLPAGLCAFHRELARRWRENHYDPRRPSEWPGGGIPVMDARTSHAERARGWDEKNRAEIARVAEACRSGRSRQCTPRPVAALHCESSTDRSQPAA